MHEKYRVTTTGIFNYQLERQLIGEFCTTSYVINQYYFKWFAIRKCKQLNTPKKLPVSRIVYE